VSIGIVTDKPQDLAASLVLVEDEELAGALGDDLYLEESMSVELRHIPAHMITAEAAHAAASASANKHSGLSTPLLVGASLAAGLSLTAVALCAVVIVRRHLTHETTPDSSASCDDIAKAKRAAKPVTVDGGGSPMVASATHHHQAEPTQTSL
jgi:hypothetical protein